MIARLLRWFRRDALADLCAPEVPRTLHDFHLPRRT